jgi:hypothetical protein
MMPPYSCCVPGRKPGHVLEHEQGSLEGVAEADEARRLDDASMSSTPARWSGWFGDDADRAPASE